MYDFPENPDLQAIISAHYEAGKIVSAVCHGVGGLLNMTLSNGKKLVTGKKITGFSWLEEFFRPAKKFLYRLVWKNDSRSKVHNIPRHFFL